LVWVWSGFIPTQFDEKQQVWVGRSGFIPTQFDEKQQVWFGRSGFIPTGFYEKQRVGRSGFIPTIAIRDKIFIPYSSGLPCEGISTSSNYFRNVELYD
jgi:hypothetical protein